MPFPNGLAGVGEAYISPTPGYFKRGQDRVNDRTANRLEPIPFPKEVDHRQADQN